MGLQLWTAGQSQASSGWGRNAQPSGKSDHIKEINQGYWWLFLVTCEDIAVGSFCMNLRESQSLLVSGYRLMD